MNIQWKIEKLSNRRLEAEIAHRYQEYAQFKEDPAQDRILPLLWDEFDARVANGKMTEDTEALLNDIRKY